ncbi:MAG: M23 family metallopeptidase [Bacteroidetes bacterium]|nr:M23 family metallopeptidase [Bacteroidota bacterium]
MFLFIPLLFISFILCYGGESSAQNKYPQGIFRTPLDTGVELVLAGNFGEIRNNHFHGGIDIKTMGVEGKPVFAVDEGTVYRIKISANGYGKVIYLRHRNGFISAYAHLKNFEPRIDQYVRNAQYANESFEIELYPKPGQFRYSKGELIAFSGNTGGSTAPHLHFEIRNANEEPLNPLLFGFNIGDSVKPVIDELLISPLDTMSHVNFSNKPLRIDVIRKGQSLKVRNPGELIVHGKIGFAVETYDQLTATSNKCGVYSVTLMIDSQVIYSHTMETFDFLKNRFINTHVDYYWWKKHKAEFQRCYLEPNNNLDIYDDVVNRGIADFTDDENHFVRLVVKDVYGNTSQLSFPVKSVKDGTIKEKNGLAPDVREFFSSDVPNTFRDQDIEIVLPAGVLYNDIAFEFSRGDTIKGALTPSFSIHNPYTPVHTYYTMSIRSGKIPDKIKNKSAVYRINGGGSLNFEGGIWRDNKIRVETRTFGTFTVYPDTTPPEIKPINISEGKKMSGDEKISVRITDNLSGINTWRATIDGRWVLMEYDPKIARLTHKFDERTKPGNHTFELTVEDNIGNTCTFKAGFTR